MKKLLIIILTLLVTGFYACKHLPPEVVVQPPVLGCGGSLVTVSNLICFQSDILPLFQTKCATAGCHDAASNKGEYILDSYDNLFKKGGRTNNNNIRPGDPENSDLLNVLVKPVTDSKKMPPPPNPALTLLQIDLITKWIKDSAKNTINCVITCDSTQFKFAANIQPILQNRCTSCHSGPNPPNCINLTTYAGVQVVALNGLLYGVVAQLPGYDPMPKGPTGKLPDCQIVQIRKWVQAGAQNN